MSMTFKLESECSCCGMYIAVNEDGFCRFCYGNCNVDGCEMSSW